VDFVPARNLAKYCKWLGTCTNTVRKGNVGAKVKLKRRKGGKSKAKKAALVAVNGKVKEQKVTKAARGLSKTPKQQALELTFHPSPNGQ